jgi:hypothetical protein
VDDVKLEVRSSRRFHIVPDQPTAVRKFSSVSTQEALPPSAIFELKLDWLTHERGVDVLATEADRPIDPREARTFVPVPVVKHRPRHLQRVREGVEDALAAKKDGPVALESLENDAT